MYIACFFTGLLFVLIGTVESITKTCSHLIPSSIAFTYPNYVPERVCIASKLQGS